MLNQELKILTELGADNCCIRFFDVERDSFMVSASHDGESAYMLGFLRHLFPFAVSTTMNVVHARIIIAHRLDI